MLNVRDKKRRKGNEQQYLSEQKAKCIFIYNITMVNILETVLAKSKEQCVLSIKKQTLYVTTNSSHQDNYQKEKNMAH